MSSKSVRTSKEAYVVVYSFLLLIVIGILLQYSMEHLILLTLEVKSDKIRQVHGSFQLRWIWSEYQKVPELKIINSEVIKAISQLKIQCRRKRGKGGGKVTVDALPSNGNLITVAPTDSKCAKFETGLTIVFGTVYIQTIKNKELSSLWYLSESNLDILVVTEI